MKLARDGKTQLEDDAEDTTVAPADGEVTPPVDGEVTPPADGEVTPPPGDGETPPEDEVVVTIGDEEPPDAELQAAPVWVKELRTNYRELQRENRELKSKVEAKGGVVVDTELGEKPKIEDFDYDGEKFGQALEAWHTKKLAGDEAKRKKQEAENAAQAAWQAKLDAYGQAKAKLKVAGMDEAEDLVKETLSTTQQGIILQGAENPALVVVALGKNPKRAKELAAINDPVKFAFAVAKLETQLKVTARKAPPPEDKVQGTGSKGGAVDSQLERLRAEAERTGNYTKVNAFKRDKRRAATH